MHEEVARKDLGEALSFAPIAKERTTKRQK